MTQDFALPDRLRELLGGADPVPPSVLAAARESFTWRTVDAELARLTEDSLLASAGVRGSGPARLLTYQVGEWTIEIQASEMAGRLRVVGQVVPPRPTRIRVDQPSGRVEVRTDTLGRFAVPDLTPGPTRFGCTPVDGDGNDAGTTVHTEWTVL